MPLRERLERCDFSSSEQTVIQYILKKNEPLIIAKIKKNKQCLLFPLEN